MNSETDDLLDVTGYQDMPCPTWFMFWPLWVMAGPHPITVLYQGNCSLEWAKSEVTWKHLWARDSGGVRNGSHHRCIDSVRGKPGRLITRAKVGCALSLSTDPVATTCLQLFFSNWKAWKEIYFIAKRKTCAHINSKLSLSANRLEGWIFIRASEPDFFLSAGRGNVSRITAYGLYSIYNT